jgi:hypothetical protein
MNEPMAYSTPATGTDNTGAAASSATQLMEASATAGAIHESTGRL